jgi:hypothetical protein
METYVKWSRKASMMSFGAKNKSWKKSRRMQIQNLQGGNDLGMLGN